MTEWNQNYKCSHGMTPPPPLYNVLLLGDEASQSISPRWFSYSVIRKFVTSSQWYVVRYIQLYAWTLCRTLRKVRIWQEMAG